VATALIMLCAARYKDTPCPVHLPRQPTSKTATETGSPGKEPGVRPAARSLNQPYPPGRVGSARVRPCPAPCSPMRLPGFKRRT
jgi:hypothetical protein